MNLPNRRYPSRNWRKHHRSNRNRFVSKDRRRLIQKIDKLDNRAGYQSQLKEFDVQDQAGLISFEIEQSLYDEVEIIFGKLGLTVEQACILFFEYVVEHGELPFEIDEML